MEHFSSSSEEMSEEESVPPSNGKLFFFFYHNEPQSCKTVSVVWLSKQSFTSVCVRLPKINKNMNWIVCSKMLRYILPFRRFYIVRDY